MDKKESVQKDINEVMENRNIILAKEKARASCHLVRAYSQGPKENDSTRTTAVLEQNI